MWIDIPEITETQLAGLSPDEKMELRAALSSPLFQKVFSIINRAKPSANCSTAGSRDRDEFSNDRANARLGEMRGWELYRAAIYATLMDAKAAPPDGEPTYPDQGRMPGFGAAQPDPVSSRRRKAKQ